MTRKQQTAVHCLHHAVMPKIEFIPADSLGIVHTRARSRQSCSLWETLYCSIFSYITCIYDNILNIHTRVFLYITRPHGSRLCHQRQRGCHRLIAGPSRAVRSALAHAPADLMICFGNGHSSERRCRNDAGRDALCPRPHVVEHPDLAIVHPHLRVPIWKEPKLRAVPAALILDPVPIGVHGRDCAAIREVRKDIACRRRDWRVAWPVQSVRCHGGQQVDDRRDAGAERCGRAGRAGRGDGAGGQPGLHGSKGSGQVVRVR